MSWLLRRRKSDSVRSFDADAEVDADAGGDAARGGETFQRKLSDV
jgi:hypothetical protein